MTPPAPVRPDRPVKNRRGMINLLARELGLDARQWEAVLTAYMISNPEEDATPEEEGVVDGNKEQKKKDRERIIKTLTYLIEVTTSKGQRELPSEKGTAPPGAPPKA